MVEKKEPRTLGGQAVIEGVMFRGKHGYAIAVRRPDGEIVWKEKEHVSPASRMPWKIPVLRGMAMMWDSMVLGTSALTWSAEVAMPEDETKKKQSSGFWGAISVFLAVVIGLGLFVGLPYLLTRLVCNPLGYVDQDVMFNLIDGVFRIIIVFGYILFTTVFKDVRRVYSYHGAEHKTINTYESGYEPTMESVANYTRFHPRCGTSFIVVVLIVLIVLHSVVFALLPQDISLAAKVLARIAMIPLVAGLAYEVIRFSGRHAKKWWAKPFIFPGLCTQFITTREPDKAMLEVALFSFNKARELEERLEIEKAIENTGKGK
jgi:uncharacterized protein YqhQ